MEYEDGGSELLKESGPIYGLGASTKLDIIKSLTLKFKSELFGGSIEYDGQTWAGLKWKKLKSSLFYEGMRFSTSSLDNDYNSF